MGNTMVVIVVYKERRMRTVNFLIVNMAVSDCLCTVIVIPKLITQIFTGLPSCMVNYRSISVQSQTPQL